MEILEFSFLGTLLREYANKYEHSREKLIVLVHWTFLRGLFLISKNGENKDIMDWIKNGDDLFDIIYFQDNNMIIETKQFFDNENFSIQFKMDENNQSFLQMKINDYINENDGSLKSINEFISEIESGIYGLDLVKKKRRWKEKTNWLLNQENSTRIRFRIINNASTLP
ncbi:unnamed protein product [Adineta steineri]|uniref:Uncharacterized protein n=2 Tax=Adineta steineri TaxID=433720 RepID=A0A819Z5Q0_9BILA|nr:unnamed protein product [Adineta steineri]